MSTAILLIILAIVIVTGLLIWAIKLLEHFKMSDALARLKASAAALSTTTDQLIAKVKSVAAPVATDDSADLNAVSDTLDAANEAGQALLNAPVTVTPASDATPAPASDTPFPTT